MQCKELEAVLEQEGLAPLPVEAQEHLAGCMACQDFLADLSTIVVAARDLAEEPNPPARIWISLRAQLEAEGVIREAEELPVEESRWQGWGDLRAWFRPRALATAAVGLMLLVTGVILSRRSIVQVPAQGGQVAQSAATDFAATTAPAVPAVQSDPSNDLRQTEGQLADFHLAGTSPADASMQQNLRTVNEFIAECEHHVKQYPDDELAREYLNSAYHQKAELLVAMMESERSEH
jgi:hypothetical protein